jgi:sugar phosphate isomerase/epimerase
MIKLGVNSVLYQGHDLSVAMQHIAWAGYDGIEVSAIKGMCEHLPLDDWKPQADSIRKMAEENHLALLSTEVASLDEERLTKAFEACKAIGIPVINVGPGGKSGVEEDFVKQTDHLARMADKAATYGLTLACKAHVGQCIYNTPTTLRAMEKIQSAGFGVDMDPSHIFRAQEEPEQALPAVLSRMRHIHIRDCKGRGPSPGDAYLQACGRGDIDLMGYFRAMVPKLFPSGRGKKKAAGEAPKGPHVKYDGPVCLEIIGAKDYELSRRDIIAAESYGYMNACLKALGAR